MHRSITDAFARLDRSRSGLVAAIDAIPATLRDQAPGTNRWSAAAVVEHLALIDERYAAIIAGTIADASAPGVEQGDDGSPELPAHVEAMLADRTERRTAPEPLHPRGLSFDAAWERAVSARAALRAALGAADGLALRRVVYEHPRFGALTGYQCAAFIAAHESRHIEQIREIAVGVDAQA
jgi:hypothetical protein